MKNSKEIIKYSFILLSIFVFALTIYPGIYKYDKFNQKLPVRINRITGTTEILYTDGWRKQGQDESEFERYKKSVDAVIDDQKNEIANLRSEIEELQNQIINSGYVHDASVKADDFYKTEVEINNEEVDQPTSFGKDDTSDTVEKVMGTPDKMIGGSAYQIWMYGKSSITFQDGVVTGWNNNGNLKLK